MKTTLTKKDDYSITIETQYEHSVVHDERINKMPTPKSDISSKVVRWLVCIERIVRIVRLFTSVGCFLVFIL